MGLRGLEGLGFTGFRVKGLPRVIVSTVVPSWGYLVGVLTGIELVKPRKRN